MSHPDYEIGKNYYLNGRTKVELVQEIHCANKYGQQVLVKILEEGFNQSSLFTCKYANLYHNRRSDYKPHGTRTYTEEELTKVSENYSLTGEGKYYFIAGLSSLVPDNYIVDQMGFYTEMKQARSAVKSNVVDINEAGAYPYMVIEELEHEGIYPISFHREFYEYNRELDEYERINYPQQLMGIGNFAI